MDLHQIRAAGMPALLLSVLFASLYASPAQAQQPSPGNSARGKTKPTWHSTIKASAAGVKGKKSASSSRPGVTTGAAFLTFTEGGYVGEPKNLAQPAKRAAPQASQASSAKTK